MKNAMIFCAAIALVASLGAFAVAGEPADVPTATLSSMGFGGVQLMSDTEGLAIRGKGTYGDVWGNSTASAWGKRGNATAYNQYSFGGKGRRGTRASGGSDSFAGRAHEYGRFSSSKLYVSGGGAWGRARTR